MNDLHEKTSGDFDESEVTGNAHKEARKRSDTQLLYKKLEVYLVLLYQAYLKKDTLIEPEIKAAIWRMVKLREGFPTKIRMMQLDYLNIETENFDGEWNEIEDSLFPIKDFELLESLTPERKKQILEYKEVVFELLQRKR